MPLNRLLYNLPLSHVDRITSMRGTASVQDLSVIIVISPVSMITYTLVC